MAALYEEEREKVVSEVIKNQIKSIDDEIEKVDLKLEEEFFEKNKEELLKIEGVNDFDSFRNFSRFGYEKLENANKDLYDKLMAYKKDTIDGLLEYRFKLEKPSWKKELLTQFTKLEGEYHGDLIGLVNNLSPEEITDKLDLSKEVLGKIASVDGDKALGSNEYVLDAGTDKEIKVTKDGKGKFDFLYNALNNAYHKMVAPGSIFLAGYENIKYAVDKVFNNKKNIVNNKLNTEKPIIVNGTNKLAVETKDVDNLKENIIQEIAAEEKEINNENVTEVTKEEPVATTDDIKVELPVIDVEPIKEEIVDAPAAESEPVTKENEEVQKEEPKVEKQPTIGDMQNKKLNLINGHNKIKFDIELLNTENNTLRRKCEQILEKMKNDITNKEYTKRLSELQSKIEENSIELQEKNSQLNSHPVERHGNILSEKKKNEEKKSNKTTFVYDGVEYTSDYLTDDDIYQKRRQDELDKKLAGNEYSQVLGGIDNYYDNLKAANIPVDVRPYANRIETTMKNGDVVITDRDGNLIERRVNEDVAQSGKTR